MPRDSTLGRMQLIYIDVIQFTEIIIIIIYIAQYL